MDNCIYIYIEIDFGIDMAIYSINTDASTVYSVDACYQWWR